jgi:hypothetical protein
MYIYPEAGGFHSPRIMANGYSSAERVKPREKRALTRWAPRAATRSQFVHPAPDPHVRLGEERVEADRTVPVSHRSARLARLGWCARYVGRANRNHPRRTTSPFSFSSFPFVFLNSFYNFQIWYLNFEFELWTHHKG